MNADDPLEQLGRALAVAPSPEFAARVRHRIDAEPAASRWWSMRQLAAAAVVMSVAVALVAQWRGQTEPAAGREEALVAHTATAPPIVAVVTRVPARPRTVSRPTRPKGDVFAETLVPDDQRLALERLLGAVRAGRAAVPSLVADDVVDEDGRRMPRALVIEPLTLELLAGTPVGANRDPIK